MIPRGADSPVAAARDWRTVARDWGHQGNERLTSSAGLILFVLLAVEAWTTLSLSSYLPLHIFLGFVLLPPVAVKLASTGWRAVRYYAGSRQYRLAGPPKLPLRLLAPLLVSSTLALFGSGVALIVVGHGRGWLQMVHAVSFGVWGVLIVVHVAAYLPRALRFGTADLRRNAERIVPGARIRRMLLAGALLAGVIIALATYPAQKAFHSRVNEPGRLQPAGTR
ncbi:MAG: hypothetical protein JWM06_903 [Actinomycetia bacterium]|nr:hypothetical protein [Actinomycetes bacterium]